MVATPEQLAFPCVRMVIEVRRSCTCKRSGQNSKGTRLFLANNPQAGIATHRENIRNRWNVENKNHHPRDATFAEDRSRCRTGNTTANLALLRGAVIALWRRNCPDAPATTFVSRNQRRLDNAMRMVNQRLTRLQ